MYEENDRDEVRERSANRLATASLVLGIISLFSTFCCCPFVFSAVGIILALVSKGAEKVLRPKAKTGLILSIAGMVVSVVIMIFSVGLPIFMFNTNPEYRKMMIEQIEESEDAIKQIYGDDVYDQMMDLFENMQ